MKVSVQNMKAVKLTLLCECDGETEMKILNAALLSYPPKYQYYCPVCNTEITDTQLYPRIDYFEEDN